MSLAKQVERERARRLAGDLFEAFSWSSAPEGYAFWQDIHRKLLRLGAEPPKCIHCGQPLPTDGEGAALPR